MNVFIDALNAFILDENALYDAVVANEPVSITEPTVKLNVVPLPSVNVITLLLTEAVTNAFDADVADDAVNEFIDAVNDFIDAVNAIIEALKALIEELNALNEELKLLNEDVVTKFSILNTLISLPIPLWIVQ